MNRSRYAVPLLATLLISLASTTSFAQVPAPDPPRTLWRFLGVPQTYSWAHAQVFNRRGNTPRLERRPPLKPLAHPLNLESPIPAIKAAAEIKVQEDLAPQKIKAIKYLASIGCGCYDKDGKITEALLAAMDDCTEDVRLAAIEAVGESAANKDCGYCHTNCCCGEKIVEQLAIIAYERDEQGCWVEPSERVRAAAIEALAACCPGRGPIYGEEIIIEGEIETPEVPEVPEGVEVPQDVTPPPPPPAGQTPPPPTAVQRQSSRRGYQTQLASNQTPVQNPAATSRYGAYFQANPPAQATRVAGDQLLPVAQQLSNVRPTSHTEDSRIVEPVRGAVAQVDLYTGIVHLHLAGDKTLPPHARVKVFHHYVTGRAQLTELEIVASRPGMADARALDLSQLPKITRGDEILGLK